MSNRTLHLILFPTEACQFRCLYCYEDFAKGRMEPAVVEGVKRLLSRRAPELDHLILSWFGGEPLLASDLVEEILQHVGDLREDHRDLQFSSEMTTNAYRLEFALFERLVQQGVGLFQVSFDGPKEHHDRKRKLANGGGTYDAILHRLREMSRSTLDFRVLVRVHVDEENLDLIPRFIDDYAGVFGADPRFELFLRTLDRMGGPNDDQLRPLSSDVVHRELSRLRDYARSIGLRVFEGVESEFICYAAKANSFVVRSDGALGKCTVALDHPKNQVGFLDREGRTQIRSEDVYPWMRGLFEGDLSEAACPMKGFAVDENEPAR